MAAHVIITKEHLDFDLLLAIIDKNIHERGCKHSFENYHKACVIFESITGLTVDKQGTLDYFKSKGGLCDSDILLNVRFN